MLVRVYTCQNAMLEISYRGSYLNNENDKIHVQLAISLDTSHIVHAQNTLPKM